ncbi:hypothetical protein [Mangrovihabitans endophyticus]|uniref:Uncharacterized protein n=1 Tax=Mangrovihabitans endophyticus TaxID=1751298 RepID=A0A8J3BYR6_9ACTN|nr:hypothetical protein [Mangrovihabitans endophyticus]GGK94783.1 hypothetical protein GCM10012284_31040 [Mangrovihabitans endophyticus]
MYAWIWRKLPFGLYGKLAGSLVLLTVIGALLWYVVFPWATPLLPFDDVQVGTGTEQGGGPGGADGVHPSDVGAPDDIPYDVNSNAPAPTASGR